MHRFGSDEHLALLKAAHGFRAMYASPSDGTFTTTRRVHFLAALVDGAGQTRLAPLVLSDAGHLVEAGSADDERWVERVVLDDDSDEARLEAVRVHYAGLVDE